MDSQSVKTTEVGGSKGYDGFKKIKGRKRFIVVDTQGNLLLNLVFAANHTEQAGGEELLELLNSEYPSVKQVLADQGYRGIWIEDFKADTQVEVAIVQRAPDQKGFVVQKTRWVVERSFAWLNRYRRLSKDYEELLYNSEAMLYLASIHSSLRRLAPPSNIPVPYKNKDKKKDTPKNVKNAA